jgi:hypothetical protein
MNVALLNFFALSVALLDVTLTNVDAPKTALFMLK